MKNRVMGEIERGLKLILLKVVDAHYSGSEVCVRPPWYTSHLVRHGLLARCLLHKTRPEMRPLAIPYTSWFWLP